MIPFARHRSEPLQASPGGSHPPRDVAAGRVSQPMRVSRFDALTSLLMATILMLGTLVSVVLIVWWIGGDTEPRVVHAPALRFVSSHQPSGNDRDFLTPGQDEVAELIESPVDQAVNAIGAAASITMSEPGTWAVHGEGGGMSGDRREPGPDEGDGPLGESGDVPPFDRWQLQFAAGSLQSYARQLDHFGVELGAIGGGIPGVDYASDFGEGGSHRRGDGASEQRLYFLWDRPNPLVRYDRQLLAASGVELTGRQVLKFIPPELETGLAAMELEYARSAGYRSVADIAKTAFLSERTSDGYRFRVLAQRYRRRPR